ncbi:MAG: hypothetical protein ABIK68_03305, partial [bacterium]
CSVRPSPDTYGHLALLELSKQQWVDVSRTLETGDGFQELHGRCRAFLERSTLRHQGWSAAILRPGGDAGTGFCCLARGFKGEAVCRFYDCGCCTSCDLLLEYPTHAVDGAR